MNRCIIFLLLNCVIISSSCPVSSINELRVTAHPHYQNHPNASAAYIRRRTMGTTQTTGKAWTKGQFPRYSANVLEGNLDNISKSSKSMSEVAEGQVTHITSLTSMSYKQISEAYAREQEARVREQEARVREQKKNYVIYCARDHQYAIRYFEFIFDKILSSSIRLPCFSKLRVAMRNESFRKVHSVSNPNVTLYGIITVIKKYNELTHDENTTYYLSFINKDLTQQETWLLFPRWINQSDEYQFVLTNVKGTQRLANFVEKFRTACRETTQWETPLTPDLFGKFILRNWNKFSRIIKLDPNYPMEDLFESLFKISNSKENLIKYCSFLLKDILTDCPLTPREKVSMKKWMHANKITFASSSLEGAPKVNHNENFEELSEQEDEDDF